MLYGVTAMQQGVSESVSELPSGAIGVLDFVNDFYQWTDPTVTNYTAADVIDTPAQVLTGCGLWTNFSDIITLLPGPFADFILSGDWTLVFEFLGTSSPSSGNSAALMTVQNGATQKLILELSVGFTVFDEAPGGRSLDPSDPEFDSGIMAVAVTADASHLAISINGSTPAQTATSGTQPSYAGSDIRIGTYNGGAENSLLGRVIFYPKTDDVNLPALAVSSVMHAPANDDWADAATLVEGVASQSYLYLATSEGSEPNLDSGDGATTWWKFTAPASVNYTIDMTGTPDFGDGFTLGVFTGSNVASLSTVAHAADWPLPTLSFDATMGTTYYIQVDSWGHSRAPVVVKISAT